MATVTETSAKRQRPAWLPAAQRQFPKVLAGRVVFFALLFGVWHWAATTSHVAGTLSTPFETVRALILLLVRGEVWIDIYLTLQSTLLGIAICTVAGVLTGLVLSLGPNFYGSASFVIDFLRTVPGLAIIPLGILVFGPTLKLDLLMITFSAVWPILLQTVYAVRQLDREILETVKIYKIPAWRRLLFVLLPACSPRIATGIRISATMSLLLALGTQLIAGSPGLGNRISVYQQNSVFPEMFACIIITGLLGIAFNAAVRSLEGVFLKWHYTPRSMALKAGAA